MPYIYINTIYIYINTILHYIFSKHDFKFPFFTTYHQVKIKMEQMSQIAQTDILQIVLHNKRPPLQSVLCPRRHHPDGKRENNLDFQNPKLFPGAGTAVRNDKVQFLGHSISSLPYIRIRTLSVHLMKGVIWNQMLAVTRCRRLVSIGY